MPSQNYYTVFASLSFVVVVELGRLARSIELSDMANKGEECIQIYCIKIPNLGRFFFIHLGNMVLLTFTLLLVSIEFWAEASIASSVLFLLTMFVIILLPLFEVEEYDKVFIYEGLPESYREHYQTSILAIGAILILPPVIPIFSDVTNFVLKEITRFMGWDLGSVQVSLLLLSFTISIVPFKTSRQFVSQLQKEL